MKFELNLNFYICITIFNYIKQIHMQRIKNELQVQIEATAKAVKNQQSKKYNYKFEDFEIVPQGVLYNWKHKSWKTWCRGPIDGSGIKGVRNMVRRYIAECQKPYGKRDLSFVHLYYDV